MKSRGADHSDVLNYLKKIEGQIRGIQKMVEENRYCIDILTQLHSAVGAISNVEDKILKKHLENCVVAAFRSRAKNDIDAKIDEMCKIVSQFRKR